MTPSALNRPRPKRHGPCTHHGGSAAADQRCPHQLGDDPRRPDCPHLAHSGLPPSRNPSPAAPQRQCLDPCCCPDFKPAASTPRVRATGACVWCTRATHEAQSDRESCTTSLRAPSKPLTDMHARLPVQVDRPAAPASRRRVAALAAAKGGMATEQITLGGGCFWWVGGCARGSGVGLMCDGTLTLPMPPRTPYIPRSRTETLCALPRRRPQPSGAAS